MDAEATPLLIQDTFKGKCILITGANGFLGKVLLEKLLRSCTGISEIIILLRPSLENKDGSTKLSRLMKSKVFKRVKSECPDAMFKVREVSGDVTSENLGLNESNLRKIASEVSFVFHCAASVRFRDDARNTLNINLVGVKNVLDLCHTMSKLEAFVHVSTAYSFCNQPIISEEVYSEKVGPSRIIETLKWMNKEQLDTLCNHVVKGRPSLYQYSKAMAEILITERYGNLPVIIVRPAIITAACKEPYAGWIDNINGPSGFIALSSKGVVRTLLVKEGVHADWVPVDLVANTLIVAAHYIAVKRKYNASPSLTISSGVPIINCVCPESNRITWLEIINTCLPLLYKYPSQSIYRFPGGTVTSSVATHRMCKLVSHYLPAVIVDTIIFLLWGKTRMIRLYRGVHGVMGHMQLYTTQPFIFTSTNMQNLNNEMCSEDKNVFPIDQNSLNWPEYVEDYVHGVRQFYMQEKDETLPSSRRKLTVVRLLWLCAEVLPICFLSLYMMKRLNKSSIGSNTLFMYISESLKVLHQIFVGQQK